MTAAAPSPATAPSADPSALPDEGRLGWIEIGRVVAILAVIAVHVDSPLVLRTSHPSSWWFGNLAESASRWCVPVFIMISGALLLTTARTADAGPFYRRRFARLGPAMVVWTIAYLIFGNVTNGIPRTLEEAIRSVLAGRPYYHLYYLFIIAGLYVVAPGLRLAVERLDRRGLAGAAAVAFGLAIGDQLILTFFGIGGPNAVTRWLPFVGFFLAGALLRDLPGSPSRVRIAAAIAVAGILATALGTALLVGPLGFGLGRGRYLYEYPSITTVPVSLAVFALLVWVGPPVFGRLSGTARSLIASAAVASFGIYLIHPMVLAGLSNLGLYASATFVPVAVVATIAVTFVISWFLVEVIRRIPGVRVIV